MDRTEFLCGLLKDSGHHLDMSVISSLASYFDELFFWNRRVNLTGKLNEDELIAKHLGDTLFLHDNLSCEYDYVLDIGTGAGIPGLLFKILRPSVIMFLADAKRKRISFLKNIILKLGLRDVYAEQYVVGGTDASAHQAFPAFPERGVDLVLSQAVCSISDFLIMARSVMSATGCVVSMKGPRFHEELDAAQPVIQRFKLNYRVLQGTNPLNGHERFLIVFQPVMS